MREQLLKALLAHANGEIQKHKANVEIYLEHPVGVGEHGDVTEAIQGELDKIAKFDDQINVINKYLSPRSKEFLG
tara:strand:- start:377 stop:601 length:225 start_codon:yes stop_codon:yes gene_type:complete